MRRISVLLLVTFFSSSINLRAQDTRKVSEPSFPPTCLSLDAQLDAAGGQLAPADESKPDTQRIQDALDHCGQSHGVVLRARGKKNAFLSGPLQLRPGVTLVVDSGVTLFASRDPKAYEREPGSCGVVNQKPPGCKPFIGADHVSDAGVMGDGTIDGRGGSTLLGKGITWWQLAEEARAGGRQQVPRILVADYADNFTLYRITLKNSPNFHVVYSHGNGFTVWGLKIDTPQRGARNTDGVDPGNGSRNITITHSYIRAGDDNVAIKGGEGGITNVSVVHNHFYWGHGMSIGSETFGGASNILVRDLSLDGPDNGIRIKSNASRGGLVHDVVYEDVCIRNSPNPLLFDTGYDAAGSLVGNRLPTYRDITLHNVRISGGGRISFNGYSADHRIAVHLNGVVATDPGSYRYSLRHTDFQLGPGPVNLRLSGGTDTTITGRAAPGDSVPSCSSKFVPFPEQSSGTSLRDREK